MKFNLVQFLVITLIIISYIVFSLFLSQIVIIEEHELRINITKINIALFAGLIALLNFFLSYIKFYLENFTKFNKLKMYPQVILGGDSIKLIVTIHNGTTLHYEAFKPIVTGFIVAISHSNIERRNNNYFKLNPLETKTFNFNLKRDNRLNEEKDIFKRNKIFINIRCIENDKIKKYSIYKKLA